MDSFETCVKLKVFSVSVAYVTCSCMQESGIGVMSDGLGCAAVMVCRRLTEPRTDFKHSVLSEWTVLLSKSVSGFRLGYDSSGKEKSVLFSVAVHGTV